MRDCHVRLVTCPGEGERLLCEFEYVILGSCVVVMNPFSARGIFNDQKQMWPSVLAVQRWIELSKGK